MDELRKMLDEDTDPRIVRMIDAVRQDGPSDDSRRKFMARFGLVGAAALGTASAGTAVKGGLFKGLGPFIKWIAVLLLGATVPVVAISVHVMRRHAQANAPIAAAAPSAPAALCASAPTAPLPDEASVLPPEPVKVATSAQPSAQAATLAEEVAALKVARKALNAGDPAGALAALDRYARRAPSGKLGQEAIIMRIEALVQKGDAASAGALADKLDPAGPYALRARKILGQASPASTK